MNFKNVVRPGVALRVTSQTLVIAFAVVFSSQCAQADSVDGTMKRTQAALQVLHIFQKTRSLADLDAAIAAMQDSLDISDVTPATFIEDRRSITSGWAQVLKSIEASYDATYSPTDPKDTVYLGLPDPLTIADPELRARVTAEIAANSINSKRLTAYREISKRDMFASAALRSALKFLRSLAPYGSSSDTTALREILSDAGLSDALRANLDPFLMPLNVK